MKALTICQPYASLIVGWKGIDPRYLKRVENRTRYTAYRGPLLIHAGKDRKWLKTWDGPVPEDMPFGALLGITDLTNCIRFDRIFPRTCDEPPLADNLLWLRTHLHVEGPQCLVLANARRFQSPIPYTGQRGLFDVPDEMITGRVLLVPENAPNY
ncbi:MAG TPA: hypothetical protein VMY37_08345 [Thermoguttaceae bacterium]|nr:hypothetical protein [Thermoguttaceae bacterium]